MKILLTGGGSGGHFYPMITVAREVRSVMKERRLLNAKLYYMSDAPYNAALLYDNEIEYMQVSSGKYRRYFSIQNFFDFFRVVGGGISGLWQLFKLYPDAVFCTGGYASFPAVFAARILSIPVVVHESDTVPGRLNQWVGKFAVKVAVSYPEAEKFFPKEKVAWTGQPIRSDIMIPANDGVGYFDFEPGLPVLAILGGSQGAQRINDTILQALPKILPYCQIIQQTGTRNLADVKNTAEVILHTDPLKKRFHIRDYMQPLDLRMIGGCADLIITRAGSTLFEIANWGVPAIVVPITQSNGDHQRRNSYAYARTGAAIVIEEENFTPDNVTEQIKILLNNKEKLAKMREAAKSTAKTDAARTIADELVRIALTHEKGLS